MKSNQQWNNAMKNNQQGRQSKFPFKAFLVTNYLFKTLKFPSSANRGDWHFLGIFYERTFNFLFEPWDRSRPWNYHSLWRGLHWSETWYWCVMTMRSCNFDKSQYRQLRMSYDYKLFTIMNGYDYIRL